MDVTAYSVLIAQVTLALHRHGDFARGPGAESDADRPGEWRHRAAVAVAIGLWLLVWLGGWWVGRTLSAGAMVPTMIGAFFGWCAGLGVATLIFFLDECL